MRKIEIIISVSMLVLLAALIGWVIYSDIASSKRMERDLDISQADLELRERAFARQEQYADEMEDIVEKSKVIPLPVENAEAQPKTKAKPEPKA